MNTNPEFEFEKRLAKIAASEEHDYQCTAYGEGQLCCIDKAHPNYEAILEAHKAALTEARIDELERLVEVFEHGKGIEMYLERIAELKQGEDNGKN